jgi:pyrimidine 5'-nucleotidase
MDPTDHAVATSTGLLKPEEEEWICQVSADNQVLVHAISRRQMRLDNLWHRATYVLIHHNPHIYYDHTQGSNALAVLANGGESMIRQSLFHSDWDESSVLIQKRVLTKDYCPGRYDPTPGGVVQFNESYDDNMVRELEEEMGIHCRILSTESESESNVSSDASTRPTLKLRKLFTFPYEDDRVRVWGQFYEGNYEGTMHDLALQEAEVASVHRMSLTELFDLVSKSPELFMPDSVHALQLYYQKYHDEHTVQPVPRKLLKGYSHGDYDSYQLRPIPKVLFFDCDDCLYFDFWKTAQLLTNRIEEWCISRHNLPPGYAYEKLYKNYGTGLRGLLAEGYLDHTDEAIQEFLAFAHDIPIHSLLAPDLPLRSMLQRIDPKIPKYIFTASVSHHAQRCISALGIADLFEPIIIDCIACDLETKHSSHAFQKAVEIVNGHSKDIRISSPEECIFIDDSISNLKACRQYAGWRTVLVGRISRDFPHNHIGDCPFAEAEIDRIHDLPMVLPELFSGDPCESEGSAQTPLPTGRSDDNCIDQVDIPAASVMNDQTLMNKKSRLLQLQRVLQQSNPEKHED